MKALVIIASILSIYSFPGELPASLNQNTKYIRRHFGFPDIRPSKETLNLKIKTLQIKQRKDLANTLFNLLIKESNGLPNFLQLISSKEFEFILKRVKNKKEGFDFINQNLDLYELLHGWDQNLYNDFKSNLKSKKLKNLMGIPRVVFNPQFVRSLIDKKLLWADCSSHVYPETNCDNDTSVKDGSLILKLEWRRESNPIPIFNDEEFNVLKMIESKDKSWKTLQRNYVEDFSDLFFIQRKDGTKFYLLAIHMMTKISSEWFWSSYWYSPKEIKKATQPIIKSFKSCHVTDYKENRPNTLSLANNQFQWCSNPYFERGENLGVTNCIGCHQHAGFEESPLGLEFQIHQGQAKNKNKKYHDYIWSMSQYPSELGFKIKENLGR